MSLDHGPATPVISYVVYDAAVPRGSLLYTVVRRLAMRFRVLTVRLQVFK
jgi:hypothetical protein